MIRDTPEQYLEKHKACGLEVGDLVHISRAPANREGGWDSVFVAEMNSYIGKTYLIKLDEGIQGFRLINQDHKDIGYVDSTSNNCLWPYFVLDKVNDKLTLTHTTDTQTNKTKQMTPFIFHSPRTVSKKAYTLVGVLDETKTIATLNIGLSVCADGDNLNKKIGIAIATGRANKAPLFILQLTADEQKQSLQKFLSFANTFTPSFALQTKLKLEVKL